MPPTEILREAQNLHGVSTRLDSIAEQHPTITEALLVIAGNVRSIAALLEVLVVTKMGPEPGPARS